MPECQIAEIVFTAIIGSLMATIFFFSLLEGPSGKKAGKA
jgi:hypothetical protein